jgi:hypothetical protein
MIYRVAKGALLNSINIKKSKIIINNGLIIVLIVMPLKKNNLGKNKKRYNNIRLLLILNES